MPSPSLCATEANRAPAKAPASSWPSMATLMTPERSPTMPASAPRISGVAAKIDSCSAPEQVDRRPGLAGRRPAEEREGEQQDHRAR